MILTYPLMQQTVADFGEDDGEDFVEEEEEEGDMEMRWSFIVGMLTNLGSLPLPRYGMVRNIHLPVVIRSIVTSSTKKIYLYLHSLNLIVQHICHVEDVCNGRRKYPIYRPGLG